MYELYAKIRDERGLKDANVAQAVGISRGAMSHWKAGEYKPKYETMSKIANVLGVSVEYLMTGGATSPVEVSSVSIPILGYVAAGVPISAITDILGEVTISEHMAKRGEFFALKIKGDSMSPQIPEGDIVIVRSQPDVESGDVAVVQIDGEEATCKKVQVLENGILLQPLNPAYNAVFYSAAEIENKPVTIIGKVMESRRIWG